MHCTFVSSDYNFGSCGWQAYRKHGAASLSFMLPAGPYLHGSKLGCVSVERTPGVAKASTHDACHDEYLVHEKAERLMA
eukprot:4258043-Amphidinium_carterae.1